MKYEDLLYSSCPDLALKPTKFYLQALIIREVMFKGGMIPKKAIIME